jgi:DNA-binding transcriptional ArsR family regulator
MKRWALSDEEKQELQSLGWKVGEQVSPSTLTQNADFQHLLELEQNHIFWGCNPPESLVVVLDGRAGGRDLFRSIGETKLLVSILKNIAPEKHIRLLRIFSCPKTPEARFWLDIVRNDQEFSSIEILIRFDDSFLRWKAGEGDPAEIKRTQARFSQLSNSVSTTRTYRNLFGIQSERVLKYYLLAGCLDAGGKDLEFPTSLNHLAELTGVPQSSVSRTFAALEEQGFVYRRMEKRSLLPQIIAGRRLLDAWWESQMQKVLSGPSGASRPQEFIYLRDPSPLKPTSSRLCS